MWCAVFRKLIFGKAMIRGLAMVILTGAMLATAGGCAVAGYAAQIYGEGPVKTRYPKEGTGHGLKNESVAVMVWVDRSVRIDYQSLQLDIANEVQTKLQIAQTKDKKAELKGATFPIEPRSIIRYQREHPEIEAEPVVKVAPVFNVSRLIFIEINNFETRPNASLELFRGNIDATIKVIEIDAAGNAKIVFQEEHMQVAVPKKAPPEGVPASTDIKIYGALLKQFTTEVTWRFFEHWEDTDL